MKIVDLTYTQFKDLVDDKALLAQYKETDEAYELFAVEAQISWETRILKNTDEYTDFETNHKANYNKPLEFRSADGLLKTASAKFADALGFWADGTAGLVSLAAEETKYMKKHFASPYTLSGVDVSWFDANWGDCLDFQVGIYFEAGNESSFYSLNQFADDYQIYQTGTKVFDVPTVKVVPPTINISGTDYDVYIRAKCVNAGPNPSKVIINLMGWK